MEIVQLLVWPYRITHCQSVDEKNFPHLGKPGNFQHNRAECYANITVGLNCCFLIESIKEESHEMLNYWKQCYIMSKLMWFFLLLAHAWDNEHVYIEQETRSKTALATKQAYQKSLNAVLGFIYLGIFVISWFVDVLVQYTSESKWRLCELRIDLYGS